MAAQRLGKRVLSKLQSPSRARGPGGSPGGLQKRHARVTVKYDRRELQRRLDVEKWIDGRLEELYLGRVRSIGRVRGFGARVTRNRSVPSAGGDCAPWASFSGGACLLVHTQPPVGLAVSSVVLWTSERDMHTWVLRRVSKEMGRARD
jgi:hypothetical protein